MLHILFGMYVKKNVSQQLTRPSTRVLSNPIIMLVQKNNIFLLLQKKKNTHRQIFEAACLE